MKTKHLLIAFFLLFSGSIIQNLFAQQRVLSGSLQIEYSGDQKLTLELRGLVSLSETFNNNLIITALPPGDYILEITSRLRGRREEVLINERIKVTSKGRVLYSLNKDGRFHKKELEDPGCIMLYLNDYYGDGSGDNNFSELNNPLSKKEFDRLLKELKDESFDKDKIALLKLISKHSYFYTEQIRDIMKLFSFDENKLLCSKILAERVVDLQNLYTLGGEFSFPTNKQKFYQFLSEISR